MNPAITAWYKMAVPTRNSSDAPEESDNKQSYKIKPNSVNGQRLCTICGCNGVSSRCIYGEPSIYRDCCTYFRFGFMCDHMEDK